MAVNGKKNIFISYRVKDTQAATGRLVDALKQHFDSDQIFMDIDKIEPGLDFTDVISNSLDNCEVMLAMIGPDWRARIGETNNYRINEEQDWVRQEIATALRRNIRVVPVLLDDAELPAEADLPEDLKPLLRRQSYEISNKRWQYDSGELIGVLQKILGVTPKPGPTPPPPPPPPAPKKSYKKYWLIAAAVFLLMVLAQMCNSTQQQEVVETQTVKNVAGNWFGPEGLRMVLTQEGGRLSMAAYDVNNQQTGLGSGVIIGDWVTIDLEIYTDGNAYPAQFKLNLSPDERSLSGNLVVTYNGQPSPAQVSFQKQ